MGENVVENEHGHIATEAIAVLGDFAEFGDERVARGRFEVIELENVAPRGEVRIAAASEEDGLGGGLLQKKGGWIFAKIVLRAANVILRMSGNPRVIGRGVVRDEIENQADATSAELFAGVIEIGPGTDARVGLILMYGIGRADDLTEFPAGKSLVEARKACGVGLEKAAA